MDNSKLPKYKGVEARKDSIRVSFQWQGNRHRETLNIPPTPKNLKEASRLREEAVRRIALGQFNLQDLFPNSPHISHTQSPTLLEVAKKWVTGQDHLAYSTLLEYKAMMNRYFIPALGDIPITEITYSKLLEVIGSQKWTSAKTRNNALTPLKRIFEMAYLDGTLESNPTDKLRNAKVQRPVPDPLTLEEVDRVLEWMAKKPQWQNYFEFAFFTGLRTSELLALRWEDVDFVTQEARVQRALVRKQIKGTKTASIRDVELIDRAMAALDRQKRWTFQRGEEVFCNPVDGGPITSDKPPRLFWNRALSELGIRHRDAYQTRHTFASVSLMLGMKMFWVSSQMGHSNAKMTFDRYAKWDPKGDKKAERDKLNKLLNDRNSTFEEDNDASKTRETDASEDDQPPG